ncbi:MAG: hypothetical protein QNJ19_04450 [Woeseiaceae bacterium]|nr:hypothetical protein [Woeseiaceae bacterium]
MQYPCPERTDLDEIRALNSAFLNVCARAPMPDGVTARIASLNYPERESLSDAPFLLFSLQEDQTSLWDRVFAAEPDFLDEPTPPEWVPITTAAVALVWHLAKRAPHDARLFAAISSSLSRRLVEHPLISVTHRALAVGISPRPRFAAQPGTWDILIEACSASDSDRMNTGAMIALQRLLLKSSETETERLAARRIESVPRSVAE